MLSLIPRIFPAVSLKRHTLWLLAGVVGLFAFGIALSLWVSLQADARREARHLEIEAERAKVGLARLMGYYRALLDNMAADPELADLMRVGTLEEQQQWALSRRRILPDLVGLALLDASGAVQGEAEALRVGAQCLADLRRAANLSDHRPLLHNGSAGLEHVDLVARVRDLDESMLGGIFVSFRLGQLQRVIDDSVDPGHAIFVLDAAGNTLIRSGSVEGARREARLALPGSGWTLIAQSPRRLLTHDGKQQVLIGLLTLAGVLLLLGVALMRLQRTVLRDVDATRDALAALAREEPVPEIVPYYAEFKPAVADINRIARNLQDQRARLEHLSLTDPLTGLSNRRALESHFVQAQGYAARAHPVALVLLDLDYFKAVNDVLGHGVGDQVLRALADSLKALTRRADFVARLAGDEFVVLLTDVEPAGLEAWHQRLADRFRSELAARGLEVKTGLSAGQTWLRKSPDDSLGEALLRADRALYRAKAHGRGQLAGEGTE